MLGPSTWDVHCGKLIADVGVDLLLHILNMASLSQAINSKLDCHAFRLTV